MFVQGGWDRGLHSTPVFQHSQCGLHLPIISLLAEDDFPAHILASEVGQLLLRDLHLLFAICDTVMLTQLCRENLEFTLGAPNEFISNTDAFPPLPTNSCIADGRIKWIVTHGDNCALDITVTHFITPVVQVVHSHATARLDQRSPFPCCRKSSFDKSRIVWNTLVIAFSVTQEALVVGITWTLVECWMPDGVILFISPDLYT